MDDPTLTDAIAKVTPGDMWTEANFLPTMFTGEIRNAIATILNAVAIGQLVPLADAEAWRNEPESSEAWCAGNHYVLDRLCAVIGADPAKVQWDGSDGSLQEETDALIWRILHHDAAAALTRAKDAENARLAAERGDSQAMHRRAQIAEGKLQRTTEILNLILGAMKLDMAPPRSAPLHSIYHDIVAARDHARAGSGRGFTAAWHYFRREIDNAKSALDTERTARLAAETRVGDASAAWEDFKASSTSQDHYAAVARLDAALTKEKLHG